MEIKWLKKKNSGKHANRLKRDHNNLERLFVREFQKLLNEKSMGCDLVDYILSDDQIYPQLCSKKERLAINTIIQWLGSSIGFSWLNEVLKKVEKGEKSEN